MCVCVSTVVITLEYKLTWGLKKKHAESLNAASKSLWSFCASCKTPQGKKKVSLSISKWVLCGSSLQNTRGEDGGSLLYHNSVPAAHSSKMLKTQTALFHSSHFSARSSSHENIKCSVPLPCISYCSWHTELQRRQLSMGQWESKHEFYSLLVNISRRQESDSHSGTACIFPFKNPPIITYLPRAQYSWSVRERDCPQAVPSQAPGLRHIFIHHFPLASPSASSSAHRLHHPIGSLHTEGEVLPQARWHALWAFCLHLLCGDLQYLGQLLGVNSSPQSCFLKHLCNLRSPE